MATLNSSTPRTWNSSEVVTAAMLNEELSSNFHATVAYVGSAYCSDTSNAVLSVPLPVNSTQHKHVRVVGRVRSEGGVAALLSMQFTGITSTVYSWSLLDGYGTASTGAQGTSTTAAFIGSAPIIASVYGSFDLTLTNPCSTAWKSWISQATFLSSTTSTGMATRIFAGLMQSTVSTVATLTVRLASGANFSIGSNLSVYWIP